VAVFHIVNFHRQQLEVGLHASGQLTRRVADQIKRALGATAIVSIRQSGTIVALLPGDREAAERTAQELVAQLEATPLPVNGHGASARVTLACGIIAFQQAGPPLARSIPAPMLEPDTAAAIAGKEVSVQWA
jgi:GGDEF domain-containing protein